jgi:hypothetical protein
MSDAAEARDLTPYQLAKQLADQGLDGPEIKRRLMEQGVEAESALLLVDAVGASMPPPELDLEVEVKTAVTAVRDLRPMLKVSTARKGAGAVWRFVKESLTFSQEGDKRLARNALVGLLVFLVGLVSIAAMYLSDTEFFLMYLVAVLPAALGLSHFLYGLTNIGR